MNGDDDTTDPGPDSPERDACCPSCGSDHIVHGQLSAGDVFKGAAFTPSNQSLLKLTLTSRSVGVASEACACRQCGFFWSSVNAVRLNETVDTWGKDEPTRLNREDGRPPSCRSCGYNLSGHQGSGDCPECGYPFVQGPSPEYTLNEMRCLRCGETVPDHFTTCWNCGNPMGDQ